MIAHTQSVDKSCKSSFSEFYKNPIKPSKTGRFTSRGPRYRLRYAQHTKIHTNAQGHVYGRLARSDEHSPSFAVSGSESGHALQVRERAKDSGVQVRQSLALQKIEAGSVDGREVYGNGIAGQKKNQGSR